MLLGVTFTVKQRFYARLHSIIELLHESPEFFIVVPVGLLAAGTVQATLVFLAKLNGVFPHTESLSSLSGFNIEEIQDLAHEILRFCLDEVYTEYMW